MADTNDILAVELVIDDTKATVKLDNFGQKIKIVSDDINKVGSGAPIAGKVTKDLTELSKRADEIHKSFQDIAKVRLDNGQIGAFTKDILTARTRSQQLADDIVNIRKELANPNRKSSIKFLTEELKAADAEAAQLNRKLDALNVPNAGGGTGKSSGGLTRGNRGSNTEFTRALLEVTDDFVPAGFNRPFNAVSKELLAVSTISSATLITFGAIAAVGYGIVKITQNIRAEAERRLHVEEAIQGAINKQIIAQREAIANFKELRQTQQDGREFNRFLQSGDLDDLKRRRANLEEIKNLIPATTPTLENGKFVSKPNERFEKNSQDILALDAQIDALQQKRTKDADDNFRQRFLSEQKSLAQSAEFAVQAQKKRSEEVEKGKAKAKELEKVYLSVYDSLAARAGQNNPFVSLFTEADKSLRTLRENTKGLSKDLTDTFEKMQAKQNEISLFSARLDNKLKVFDLRDSADAFRNPKKEFDAAAEKARTENLGQQAFESGVAGRIRANNGEFGKLTDAQKQQIYQQAGFDYVGQLNQSGSTFNALNQNSLISRFASENKQNPNLSLQERLQKQFDIVDSLRGTAKTDDEKSIADRRIIALTNGLNPNQLTDSEREKAAIARENEAVRASNAEKNAKAERAEDRKIQQQIADNTKRFLDLAEKEGLKAVLEIVDKTGGGINLESSGTNKDTQDYYSR